MQVKTISNLFTVCYSDSLTTEVITKCRSYNELSFPYREDSL